MRSLFVFAFTIATLCNVLNGSDEPFCHSEFYTKPECIDQPEGYLCDCGPGFYWNSEMCVSAAIDSRMTFIQSNTSIAYSILPRKTLPATFTLSVWLRPQNVGSVVSLKKEANNKEVPNYMRIALIDNAPHRRLGGKPSLQLQFQLGASNHTDPRPVYINEWVHLVWTQRVDRKYSQTEWHIYMNGSSNRVQVNAYRHDEVRGELILGQSSRDSNKNFVHVNATAYEGDMAHFHLWNRTFNHSVVNHLGQENYSNSEIWQLLNDCLLRKCGNVVQWADLRFGTHGSLRLKWPSGVINRNCLTLSTLKKSCDITCSQMIGAQCKSEIRENIHWPREKAGQTSILVCPGEEDGVYDSNEAATLAKHPRLKSTSFAQRFCDNESGHEGVWREPMIDNCTSDQHKSLVEDRKDLERQSQICALKFDRVIEFLEKIVNITRVTRYSNPVNIAMIIDCLVALPNILDQLYWRTCDGQAMSQSERGQENLDDIQSVFKLLGTIVNSLLSKNNEIAWLYTRPAGHEAFQLANFLDRFSSFYISSLVHAVINRVVEPRELAQHIVMENFILKFSMQPANQFNSISLSDRMGASPHQDKYGVIHVPRHVFGKNQDPSGHRYYTVLLVIYPRLGDYLPHVTSKSEMNKITGKTQRISSKINSAVFQSKIYIDRTELNQDLWGSIEIKPALYKTSNISNQNCVKLALVSRSGTPSMGESIISSSKQKLDMPGKSTKVTPASNWIPIDKGSLSYDRTNKLVCLFGQSGFHAVTTDMFDPHWKANEKPNFLIALPSYVGCLSSAAFCLITFALLVYFKTSSNTASIHRNFAVSIAAGQLVFLFGIDKFYHPPTCHVCAILLHYFFLASFSWLMNEAFNLYIVITYAAHSHGEHTEGGMWRYYLLGWITPGILVGAFVGANSSDYYARDMCWISLKHFWLFAGPAIGIIAITVLVLIFTAKEHNESSYTKNEKANKAIFNQTKALWTQALLLTIAWSFAFVSIVMSGIIIKWLFAMFNFLQGTFFIGFYFLLNEEVQSIHNKKHRKLFLGDSLGAGDEEDEEEFENEEDVSDLNMSPTHRTNATSSSSAAAAVVDKSAVSKPSAVSSSSQQQGGGTEMHSRPTVHVSFPPNAEVNEPRVRRNPGALDEDPTIKGEIQSMLQADKPGPSSAKEKVAGNSGKVRRRTFLSGIFSGKSKNKSNSDVDRDSGYELITSL